MPNSMHRDIEPLTQDQKDGLMWMNKKCKEFEQSLKEENHQEISVEYRPAVIDKSVYDILLKSKYPVEALAIYNFYYYTAIWQKTNQPYATNEYVMSGLRLSELKFKRGQNILFEVGLIERIQKIKNGKFGKTYIKVNYYATKKLIDKLPGGYIYRGAENNTPNTYISNKKNTYKSNTNISKEILQENPDKEKIKKPFVAKKENRKITNLIYSLTEILKVPKLEGTVKDNRYMAKHLLDDIEKAKIPIPQFFECFTNCVRDCKEFRTMTSLREIRNKFPKIIKVGSDMRARGYHPGYAYTQYHYIKGNNYLTVENFQIDVHGNKIEQEFDKYPITNFSEEFLRNIL